MRRKEFICLQLKKISYVRFDVAQSLKIKLIYFSSTLVTVYFHGSISEVNLKEAYFFFFRVFIKLGFYLSTLDPKFL